MQPHALSLILFTPLAGLLVLLLIPASRASLIRIWANIVSLFGLVLAGLLVFHFDPGKGYQFVERYDWVPSLGVQYALGIDGISLLLVLLTSLTGFLAVLCSWCSITERVKEYYAVLLLLQTGMLGVFLALDLVLFFVFYEVVLVPMYFLIVLWGGERRLYAGIKFFLYTVAGSVFLLLGIIAVYVETGTFNIEALSNVPLAPDVQRWVFWAFFAAFAVKVPMFPLHTWLPDAHTEAPTAGSLLLAAVLLKMGSYGFLRLSLPLLPDASADRVIVQILAILSIVAILYGALVSLTQKDWKRLVAYSSVSHMGFITLGIFSLTPNGLAGAALQQINHGLSTGLLFLLVGMVYERRQTRAIADYGGLAKVMPNFAVVFAFAMFSSAGLPLLNGFIGEFAILQGAFEANRVWAYFAVPGLVLGAAYLLWLYQRTMFGSVTNEANLSLRDLSPREWAVVLPLIAWSLWIGLYPKPFFDVLAHPVAKIVERVQPNYFTSGGPSR